VSHSFYEDLETFEKFHQVTESSVFHEVPESAMAAVELKKQMSSDSK
jgi:hypothetical protein